MDLTKVSIVVTYIHSEFKSLKFASSQIAPSFKQRQRQLLEIVPNSPILVAWQVPVQVCTAAATSTNGLHFLYQRKHQIPRSKVAELMQASHCRAYTSRKSGESWQTPLSKQALSRGATLLLSLRRFSILFQDKKTRV